MQFKFWVLCTPFVLATVAQAAPEPLPQLSSSPLKPDAPEGHQAPFSSITIAGVRLGSPIVVKSVRGPRAASGVFTRHSNPTAMILSGPPSGKGGFSVQKPNKLPRQAPGWFSSVEVKLDENHMQWSYDHSSLRVVTDRRGVVDAVVADWRDKTVVLQAEGITGSVALGDDLRKVLRLFGSPKAIGSYGIDDKDSKSLRTFELRYSNAEAEAPTYVVFTIRDNHVVRFYAYKE